MMGIMAHERGGQVFATDERSVSAFLVGLLRVKLFFAASASTTVS